MAPLPVSMCASLARRQSDLAEEDDVPDHEPETIKLDTFLSICAATAIIFILTVLVWKIGYCVRRLTRQRVLGGGKPAAVAYAKTWYGWVPLEEEKERKDQLNRVLHRLHRRFVWRSCRADYSWVWWDPEGAKLAQHYRDQAAICWIPKCFRSYSVKEADAIWNPVKPRPKRQAPRTTSSKQQQSQTLSVVKEMQSQPVTKSHSSVKYKALGATMQRNGLGDTPGPLKGLAGRPGSLATDALNSVVPSPPNSSECYGVPREAKRQNNNDSRTRRQSRPPQSYHALTRRLSKSTPFPQEAIEDAGCAGTRGYDGQLDQRVQFLMSPTSRPSPSSFSRYAINFPRRSMSDVPPRRTHTFITESFKRRRAYSGSDVGSSQTRSADLARLTNPEIRFVDDLDRRLEWLCSEMDPGRKPPNFALLHNHWLNKQTWLVFDPPSRVNLEERRQYGDPRFNHPWPGPQTRVRPKYPVPPRVKADNPRLDSWRVAVNRARKSSGIRNFLNAVELFEGSAEDPGPGAVDPASWILKRPPQGCGPPAKQRSIYYEGGGGWCERLDDWQKVGRAYRVRKVICEGKAHRRRAMELARSVSGGCRAIARKATPVWAQNARNDIDLEKRRRRERSGCAHWPDCHRRYRNHDDKPIKHAPGARLRPMLSAAVTDSVNSNR